MVHAVVIVAVQNQAITRAPAVGVNCRTFQYLALNYGVRASFEQFGTSVMNTFSFRFSKPKTGVFPAAPRPLFPRIPHAPK